MNWEEVVFGAVSIIGLIEWIKSFDKEKKWKKFYKFLPLLLSTLPAILISHMNDEFIWSNIILLQLGIFSFSIIGYHNIVELINKKLS